MCFVNICQAGRFVDDLAKLGIIPDKTKRIPPPQLESDLLKLAYLRGYIDGDGHTCVCDGAERESFHLGVASSCQAILLWFKALCDRIFPFSYMDRDYSEVNEDNTNGAWHYNINGHRALRIISILSRIPTPELARKWKKPRLLELIEESKVSHPAIWAQRLPIEDEIDAYLSSLTPSPTATSTISFEHPPISV